MHQQAHPFHIVKAEAMVFRAPIDTPVRTSFATMHNRPALLIRLTDIDGFVGWGEVWCNFPSVGAEHRARLLSSVVAPMLCAGPWASPFACFDALTARTHILALQTGEPGPLAQIIAGVDIAVWDLVAKRAAQPLWQLLGGEHTVAVYASGISPDEAVSLVDAKAKEGYTAFKLKVGFDDQQDEKNVQRLRDHVGPEGVLMVDANQAWSLERARKMIAQLAPYGLAWIEEPVPADTPWASWRQLADGTEQRLAAGENLRGAAAFYGAHTEGGLRVIQPDIGKWGGFSGCLPVGRTANEQGHWFCPHWLGAGIGLRASMHLKAAVGGPGYVEVDSNPNPLRELLADPDFSVQDGTVSLTDEPGLGVEPLLDAARPYLVPVLAE
ncbi:mandelate racemase/muconate lactonizing enzyme family protein [Pusillimonas sp. SM2304]|uniref:mandelate racemase/muconate lactonizing enzyme family protein n=1 Tax=Pusillimonas sp. SM2304 TaxID=3073241 RepID=UPI002876A009|nr:mandelate racemase/muconate lactonizing enzyme family protein [Pusillimonas sp. SM2304]MDS1139465.1 mandelate racemase/muconate lactonizing enzyme family protein [Pusillimonas sp. SM2304]